MEYILMHRTKEIARIELDEFSNIASIYEVYDSKHLPVGTVQKEVVNFLINAMDLVFLISIGFYLKVNESHGKQLTFLIILFQRMLEIFCLVMAVHLRV